MKNLNKTDIGLIGLAVMGENLALNMADKGWNVSVYNRTVPGVEEGVVERFVNGRAKGKKIEGYTDIAEFVTSIAIPRKIMMMVRAGSAVDDSPERIQQRAPCPAGREERHTGIRTFHTDGHGRSDAEDAAGGELPYGRRTAHPQGDTGVRGGDRNRRGTGAGQNHLGESGREHTSL